MLALTQGMMSLGAGGGGGSDPFFANVVSLLQLNANTNDLIPGKTWVNTGTATITSAQSRFGGASLELTSSGDNRIDCSSTDFNFGTGDFCIEGWFRPDSATNRSFFSFGTRLVYSASGSWAYFNGGNAILAGTASADVWVHIALTRASGTTRLFAGGSLLGSTSEASAIDPGTMRLGWYNSGNPAGRFYDEFRVTKGVARYTDNFTPPTAPFPTS